MPTEPTAAKPDESDREWRDILAALGTSRVYPAQTIIIHEGDTSDMLYLIREGSGRVYSSNAEGRVIVYSEFGPGDLLGEPALDGGPRSASVMTTEKTTCVVIRIADFKAKIATEPALAMQVIFNLIRLVRSASENVKSLALDDVYGRVVRLLMKIAVPDGDGWIIPHKLTHQEIADHVGSSREMVGRILKDLQTGGYVVSEKNAIVIRRKPPSGW
jgi:CRP/FNR family cyclic AMP-dependent transcriptional regulator